MPEDKSGTCGNRRLNCDIGGVSGFGREMKLKPLADKEVSKDFHWT
jgi:hypothetical protein